MYSYIIGEVKALNEGEVVLENNGIGYRIQASLRTISRFELNQTYKIYTSFQVREDGIYLYGFYSEEELEMFDALNKVSTIGPKTSLAILSTLSVRQIQLAIRNNDIAVLTQAPGIGKKSASRIILELVDWVEKQVLPPEGPEPEPRPADHFEVAVDALMNLGYPKNTAERAVKGVTDSLGVDAELQDIIKAALKNVK